MTSELPDSENPLVKAAERQVDALVAAALLKSAEVRRLRFLARVSTASAVILAVMVTVVSILAVTGYSLARSVQSASVSQCRAGNTLRAGDTQVWDAFIALILRGNHNPGDLAKGRSFERYVAKVDAPRDCQKVYGVSGGR